MGRSGSASGTGSASVTTCVISASTLANRGDNEGRMNVAALAIPLTGLFTCANLCAAACRPCFVLNTSTSGQPLFAGDSGLFLIVFTHGSGFPLAHTAPHQPRAVGFANIFAFDEDVEHSHVSAVVVQVKFTAPQS